MKGGSRLAKAGDKWQRAAIIKISWCLELVPGIGARNWCMGLVPGIGACD